MNGRHPNPLNYAPPQRKQWRTLTVVIVTLVVTLVFAALFALSWVIVEIIKAGPNSFPAQN